MKFWVEAVLLGEQQYFKPEEIALEWVDSSPEKGY